MQWFRTEEKNSSQYAAGIAMSLYVGNTSLTDRSYCSFFFFSTMASITATAVMFTMSRTEASQSVK